MVAAKRVRRIQLKNQFIAEIQGREIGHFNKVSKTEGQVALTPYKQGGDADVSNRSYGNRTFTKLTLSAGVSEVQDLWIMWKAIYDAQQLGQPDDSLVVTITIKLLDRSGRNIRDGWIYNECYMDSFGAADEFDADSSANLIQEASFEYRNFDKLPGFENVTS